MVIYVIPLSGVLSNRIHFMLVPVDCHFQRASYGVNS